MHSVGAWQKQMCHCISRHSKIVQSMGLGADVAYRAFRVELFSQLSQCTEAQHTITMAAWPRKSPALVTCALQFKHAKL